MTKRAASILAASAVGLFAATIALAQVWGPLSGVMPSYLQPPLKASSTVSDRGALASALARAKGGEVIGLAPGTYSIELSDKQYARPVTITSANPGKPALIDWIKLKSVRNLTFTRLELTRTAAPGEKLEGPFIAKIIGGENITFDRVYVHGSLDNDATNDINGLQFGGTRNPRVTNSEFTQLGRGAQFGGVENATVANNRIHAIRSDGFNFAESVHLLIEGNHFSDSQRIKSDHPDAIQFWTVRTKRPSTDIVIRNNQIIQGEGSGTQGIFMRDESQQMPYERVTIENNLIVASNMANGIYVSGGIDINILNNTVLSRLDDRNPVWIKTLRVENLKLEGNIAEVGGNKSPGGAKINKSLLKGDRFKTIKAEDVVVPGIGFQLKERGAAAAP